MTEIEHHFDWHGLKFTAQVLVIVVFIVIAVPAGYKLSQNPDKVFEVFSKTHKSIAGLFESAEETTKQPPPDEEELDIKLDVGAGEDNEPAERRVISAKTIEEAAPEEGRFVGVDLKAMKVYLYEDRKIIAEYPVLSKGRPGSQWETPSGNYEVLYKNPSHFSSIGHVYMPYSMQFYGNFFIHGWPTYPDGRDVEPGFSGGCVRLETDDAKAVFEFGDIETPIFVYDTDLEEAQEEQEVSTLLNIDVPKVSAKSYLIADLTNGEVFAERNAFTTYPIASITKLMTAVVANETIAYDRLIPISQVAYDTEGYQGGLTVGESMTLSTLLYPLLLNSSNDAAVAIAEYRGLSAFVTLMNQKARALDMQNTVYADTSGLSELNVSTASDLFQLAKYIHEKKRFIFDVTQQLERTITADTYNLAHTFTSNNPMRIRDDWLGGKNGFTDEARKTLLSLFTVGPEEQERTIAVIVLGSENHTGDTIALNGWINKALVFKPLPVVSTEEA